MAPKQLATEDYLSGDIGPRDDAGGMSTPPKNRPPPVDTSPASTAKAHVVPSRRRSVDSPRELRGNGGFLYGSRGSLDSAPDENDGGEWEQNSLSGASHRSLPAAASNGESSGGGSNSPRSARAVLGPMHRSVSSPSFPRSPSSGKKKATLPAFKVFVLLLRPRDKIFELIQVEYDPSRATIGDVLDLVPASATEPKLGNQRHIGLMRTADGTELTDLTVPASPSVFSADGTTANVARGDILVAIPEGYTGEKCRQLSDKILRNPKMVRLLRRKDPLKPKRSRSSSGGSTGGGSVSSSGSGRSSVDSMTSSVGSFKRRGSRRVACVPPTVMEEDGPEVEEKTKTPTAANTSSGASVSAHSLETASIRNTSIKTGSTLPGMEAIAELLSKDSEHEKRRRKEEERARAQVEERKRAAVEAKARAEAEERIRGEIERKAREKAEEERKKREEAEEQRRREEEERSRRAREEERRIEELARKAEAAERAWEKVCAPEDLGAPSTPPGSPRVRKSSFGSPGGQARNITAAPYPAEIEVPSEQSSNKGGGLEMFVFGMISSAVMVALTARTINSSHPQVVMVQETAAGAVGTISVDAPQVQDSVPMQGDPSDADFRRKIAYSFALFVFLQVIVMLLVRSSPRARRTVNRIGRKVRRKIDRLRGKVGGGGSDFASPKRRSVMLSPPNQGAPGSAGGMTRSRSRSTLAEAAQAAAKRSDYGYGSGGGANWRKAANL